MVTSYKYIVLVIIFFIIIYNFRKSEKFDNINDNQIIFNADEYLKNLTEDQSKKMLVSSQILPWVKFTETNTAEEIYKKLFINKERKDDIIKDIIDIDLDNPINTNNSSLTDEERTVLFNDILKNLKLTKKTYNDTNISGNEIDDYGELLGFIRNYENGTLTIPSTIELRTNILDNKKQIKKMLKNYKQVDMGGIILPPQVPIDDKEIIINKSIVETIDLDKFPNNLKYRVRNNREAISNSLANILNAKAIQKKWDWQKVNVGGIIITDTTINSKNILFMKKSKINRILDIDINNINRPRQCLNFLLENQRNHIYNLLLNLNNTEYDSNDKVLDINFVNSYGQVIYQYPSDATPELLNKYQNNIQTILEHNKIDNIYNINPIRFIRNNRLVKQDDLGLPLFLYDYTPAHNIPIKITRGFVNEYGELEESTGDILSDNEIIYLDNSEKTRILKVVGSGESKIYQIYNDNQWKDFQLLNSFEWHIPELEKRGRNQSNFEIKFDLVALNNSLYNILSNDKYDNFITQNNSNKLKLPIAWKNSYPLSWDEGISQVDASQIEHIVLKRKTIDPDDESKLIDSINTGVLQENEYITGTLDNILLRKSETSGRYIDGSGIFYPETNITESTGKIGWKAQFLEDAFKNTDNVTLKKELALINRLLVSRAKTELKKKNSKLPYGSRNKVSLVAKIPPQDDTNWISLSDTIKNTIYTNIANTLSNYNVVISGSKPEITATQVAEMNRLNLASIMENGIQNVERLIIRNGCNARESYPLGEYLNDVRDNNINYFYISDIRRLQKAIFSVFNNYKEPEDSLPDIIYAGHRLRLILNAKGDKKGTFILNQIDNVSIKDYIRNAISIVQNINFENADINNEYIEKNILSTGLTLGMLSDIYSYINLDDYLSVKLDIIKTSNWFNSYYSDIDNNIKLIRTQLKNKNPVSDEDIKEKYNYVNARNVINETKNRISSMNGGKKLEILNIIRSNIVKRQENSLYSTDILSDIVNKNVTLETSFKTIKIFHLNTIMIENNTSAHINNKVLETYDDLLSGYSKNNKYY